MKACFPGSLLPEMHSQKTWGKDKKMDIKVWFALRDRIYDQMEYFGWQHVRQAAEDFGLHVEQVRSPANQALFHGSSNSQSRSEQLYRVR